MGWGCQKLRKSLENYTFFLRVSPRRTFQVKENKQDIKPKYRINMISRNSLTFVVFFNIYHCLTPMFMVGEASSTLKESKVLFQCCIVSRLNALKKLSQSNFFSWLLSFCYTNLNNNAYYLVHTKIK